MKMKNQASFSITVHVTFLLCIELKKELKMTTKRAFRSFGGHVNSVLVVASHAGNIFYLFILHESSILIGLATRARSEHLGNIWLLFFSH